jgi:hypothetical protein
MPALDLRQRVDSETAGYIANQLPRHHAERDAILAELLAPVVRSAVSASRASVASALGRLDGAAELMLPAHGRAEEAEGVARALRLARSAEPWTPSDVHAEASELFGFSLATG